MVALDCSTILYYFPQGGKSVPCPHVCVLVAPSFAFFCCGFPFFRVPVLDLDVCAGVVEGLGWYGGL